MHITGQCHCGNVAYTLDWEGEPAQIPSRTCGCTFCAKHGATWTSRPEAKLAVTIADPANITKYEFGTKTATFHVCARCGVPVFVTCTMNDRAYAVVNVNTFDNVDASRIIRVPASFDGEDVGSRLARRERNWIADVRIDGGHPAAP